MEHTQTYPSSINIQKSLSLTALIVMVFMISGCKPKPIPNPESLDPIFADLSAQAAALNSKAEGQQKKIEELEKTLEEFASGDPAQKRTRHEKEMLERGLVQIKQDALYFEVRAKQRQQFAKMAYLKAFAADKPWPDPSEFEEYKERKKLRGASRDWSERVPKMTGYNKPDPNAKPEKKAEAKPEGEAAAPAGGH